MNQQSFFLSDAKPTPFLSFQYSMDASQTSPDIKSFASLQNSSKSENRLTTSSKNLELDEEERLKYRERRDKNNLAAKKSRSNRRERERQMQFKIDTLEKERDQLRNQVNISFQRIGHLEDKLRRCGGSTMSFPQYPTPQEFLLRDNTNSVMAPNSQNPFMYPF